MVRNTDPSGSESQLGFAEKVVAAFREQLRGVPEINTTTKLFALVVTATELVLLAAVIKTHDIDWLRCKPTSKAQLVSYKWRGEAYLAT